MNTHKLRSSFVATVLAATVLGVGGCSKLDVENPNAPDVTRALGDPAGLEQLLGGAFRTWIETRGSYLAGMPMNAMADSYTASWNNAAARFYSSVGSDCTSRCAWTNSATAPEAAGGPTVEATYYGYYTVLSAANDVLAAIADGLCFDGDFTAADCAADNTRTSRDKAIAKMVQGMALGGISQVYDQGFIVDETTDLTALLSAPFNTRIELRDAALTKFEEAYAEAGLKAWSTDAAWMGVGAGKAYTNTQIRQLIRTMQAELIAMWPRDDGENAQADWAQVATFASQGVSSGTAFDWEFFIDASSVYLETVKTWGNALLTMRVDTRVATLLTTNHVHPWPEPAGNPCPTGAGIYGQDRRVGDGTYGPTDDFSGGATVAATANAGTDYACSGVGIFPAARGQYHQSNLQHIRYQRLTYEGEGLPGFNGVGQDPMFTREMNDLLWAEGELRRTGGNPVLAAGKINNSRNGRGGLALLTGAEGTAALLTALRYEQHIEFMGQGMTPFFNRRRWAPGCANPCSGVDGLINGTPRHMPVPAKELDVLLRASYTFGGSGSAKLVAGGPSRPTVRERWKEIQDLSRTEMFKRRL